MKYSYLEVQPAGDSFMHIGVLSSLHTADYLSATQGWKKLSGLKKKSKEEETDGFGVKTNCPHAWLTKDLANPPLPKK